MSTIASAPESKTIHASCVEIDGRAILLAGASGSGKSDLALRLLDRGAKLVSDDYTILRRDGDSLIASAPANIAGQMEVRGVGLIEWPATSEAAVVLCLTLDCPADRLPPDPLPKRTILGLGIPLLAINALEPSAPIKVELALRQLLGGKGQR